MRNLVLAFAFLTSNQVFACPNLVGDYLCVTNDFRRDTVYTFEQNKVGRHWEYTISATPVGEDLASSYTVRADGNERVVVDRITGVSLKAKAYCRSNTLVVKGSAQVGANEIQFSEKLSVTKTGDLSNISLDINGNTVHETCARIVE